MKARLIICMMTVLLMVTGCLPESADIQGFSEKVTLLSAKVDAYQAETGGVIDLLVADGIISKELAVKVDEASEKIDRIQPLMTGVAEAIKNTDYVSGDDVGNIIKAARAGTAATAPWNPYAAPILLGLSLLEGVVLLLVNRSKNKEAAKRDADKAGREKTLREIATIPEDKLTAAAVNALMYSNIGEARRAIT